MKNTQYTGTDNLLVARGKVFHNTSIQLPDEWEQIADSSTITVSITPCGAPQDIIIKTVDIKEIRLQSNSGYPIECYYHVFVQSINR